MTPADRAKLAAAVSKMDSLTRRMDEWSDEARQKAIETRRRNAKGSGSSAGSKKWSPPPPTKSELIGSLNKSLSRLHPHPGVGKQWERELAEEGGFHVRLGDVGEDWTNAHERAALKRGGTAT